MKLWFKILKDDKMIYSATEENSLSLNQEDYERTLTEMCHKANLSTPVSLVPHFMSLVRFNVTDYLPRDFIESVDFDKVIIENITEDDEFN